MFFKGQQKGGLQLWIVLFTATSNTFPLFFFYSVAVTRSQDVPSFGPPIPKGVTFPKSTVFRDFLLGKVINAENAAHKSDKFGAMATRTRQEYLRDLAERHVTSTPVEPTGKFPFISLAHKRREKVRPYSGAELRSLGAVTWQVHAEDQVAGAERECLLAISNDFIILLDQEAKAVVFNCATRDVIGWSTGSPASMKIYYERGESVSLRSINNNTEDFGEVVKRLEVSGPPSSVNTRDYTEPHTPSLKKQLVMNTTLLVPLIVLTSLSFIIRKNILFYL